MQTVVLTIHLLLALALIGVVLLQRSEGGGLGIGGGGGVMTGRAAATALSKLTWALGIAFVVTSLTLTVIAARNDGGASVIDRLGIGVGTSPETPGTGLGEELLPPVGPSAPNVAPQQPQSPALPPVQQ